MIIKEQKPIKFLNECGCLVDEKTLEKAIKKVFDHFDSLSEEEFMAEMDKYKPNGEGCCPVFCEGECQGIGWCNIAAGFRKDQGWGDSVGFIY